MTDDPIAQRLLPWLSRARARTLLHELVRVPSPQTDLLEAEPLLSEFMDVAARHRVADVQPHREFSEIDPYGTGPVRTAGDSSPDTIAAHSKRK
jgi:hypothetical protein